MNDTRIYDPHSKKDLSHGEFFLHRLKNECVMWNLMSLERVKFYWKKRTKRRFKGMSTLHKTSTTTLKDTPASLHPLRDGSDLLPSNMNGPSSVACVVNVKIFIQNVEIQFLIRSITKDLRISLPIMIQWVLCRSYSRTKPLKTFSSFESIGWIRRRSLFWCIYLFV